MASDTEEEDDDDPDGSLEADLDKDEMIQVHETDHVGDEFLRLYYFTNSSNVPKKKRVCLWRDIDNCTWVRLTLLCSHVILCVGVGGYLTHYLYPADYCTVRHYPDPAGYFFKM